MESLVTFEMRGTDNVIYWILAHVKNGEIVAMTVLDSKTDIEVILSKENYEIAKKEILKYANVSEIPSGDLG